MEPKVLVDTDVLSALMRNNAQAVNRARTYLADHVRFTISLVTRFEILRGLKARRAVAQLAAFERFCTDNEILAIGDDVVVRAADIYADLYVRGQLVADADILIAATAVQHRLVLATNNVADFRRIAGLPIDNWLG